MEEVYCGLRFKRTQSTLIGRHGDGGLAAVAVEASPHLGRSGSRVGRKHPQDQAVNLRTYTHSHSSSREAQPLMVPQPPAAAAAPGETREPVDGRTFHIPTLMHALLSRPREDTQRED